MLEEALKEIEELEYTLQGVDEVQPCRSCGRKVCYLSALCSLCGWMQEQEEIAQSFEAQRKEIEIELRSMQDETKG